MFLHLAIVFAFMGSVYSAMQLSSEETGYKVSDKVQLNFYSYIDKRESGNFIHLLVQCNQLILYISELSN